MDYHLVVDPIVTEYRQGESHRWRVACLVHEAYAELEPHSEGLTRALCDALVLGEDQVRNLGRAWELWERYKVDKTELSTTHFSRMYGLQLRYGLSDWDVLEYLHLAENERWSVAKMSLEVERNHDCDPAATFQRRQGRLVKALRWWYEMSETYHIDDAVRQKVREALEALDV